jgi:hypothetical protein
MLFIVRFLDHPDRLEIRKKFLAEHFEWLDAHKDVVLVAGSARPDPETPPVGAYWIAEAAGRGELESLLLTDPFWREGLRQSYEIFLWTKAFPDRKVPV